MTRTAGSPILHVIRRAVEDQRLKELPDQELLRRFSTGRDEAAYSALLRRHGPMVLDICRNMLGNEADAEDAFQATFLVLAQRAGAIRKTSAVGSWLHGVAYRTALRAQAEFARRHKHEARASAQPPGVPSDDLTWREVQQALHAELNRLSECYRAPLVLCYLEGRTHDEAALLLGVSRATVKKRLEFARALLRQRLVRRGLGPAALLVAAAWPAARTSAQPPSALVSGTVKGATLVAAGQSMAGGAISAKVIALSHEVLKTMVLTRLKRLGVVLLAVALAGTGTGVLTYCTLAGGAGAAPPAREAEQAPAKPSTLRTLRLPETPDRYSDIDLPAHFQTPVARRFDNTPADNPVTDAGATLGRVLFYDTRLSANNTVSCGSCHVQKNAFVDPNRFSKGFEGKPTDRHAMSLANLRHYTRGRFFWDERGRTLEEAVLVPVQSKTEMGQDLTRLTEVLAEDQHYPGLFKEAFGDGKVTQERIARALAQFLRSMVSCQSKYDEGRAQVASVRDDFPNYTVQENRGKALFVRNCAICHLPGQDAHFSMIAPANNGLDEDYKNADSGVGDITVNGRDIGRFKSPSLRNVEVTAPYMHDGRFDTLEKVIDHYSKEVKPHPNLDPRVRRLNFTDSEKAALVAFLKTLTDQKFLTDPKFSDPFQ
jgi:cytochrome c peroxidase